jgi:hypothetical protein
MIARALSALLQRRGRWIGWSAVACALLVVCMSQVVRWVRHTGPFDWQRATFAVDGQFKPPYDVVRSPVRRQRLSFLTGLPPASEKVVVVGYSINYKTLEPTNPLRQRLMAAAQVLCPPSGTPIGGGASADALPFRAAAPVVVLSGGLAKRQNVTEAVVMSRWLRRKYTDCFTRVVAAPPPPPSQSASDEAASAARVQIVVEPQSDSTRANAERTLALLYDFHPTTVPTESDLTVDEQREQRDHSIAWIRQSAQPVLSLDIDAIGAAAAGDDALAAATAGVPSLEGDGWWHRPAAPSTPLASIPPLVCRMLVITNGFHQFRTERTFRKAAEELLRARATVGGGGAAARRFEIDLLPTSVPAMPVQVPVANREGRNVETAAISQWDWVREVGAVLLYWARGWI